MEKIITFEMKNGAKYALPLRVVADDRAKYYAEKDKDTTYESEFDFVMSDDYEGIDWFQNNMNCEDVKEHFVQIMKPPAKEDWERIQEAVSESECEINIETTHAGRNEGKE